MACAAAVAVIETLRAERLPDRAAALGKRTMERLRAWAAGVPEIAEGRGLGLMIGIEFMRDGRPAPEIAAHVQRRCVERDLLLLTCGIDDNVIRLLPPLTIGEEDLDRGLSILEQCVRAEIGR